MCVCVASPLNTQQDLDVSESDRAWITIFMRQTWAYNYMLDNSDFNWLKHMGLTALPVL